MKDKKKDDTLPKVSKEIKDLPRATKASDKVKGGAINVDAGGTMAGGTGTTSDSTILM
jgi:hypothetical protein